MHIFERVPKNHLLFAQIIIYSDYNRKEDAGMNYDNDILVICDSGHDMDELMDQFMLNDPPKMVHRST